MLVEAKLSLSLGVVQTAYANGASTIHLKQALAAIGGRCQIACVATGVSFRESALLLGATLGSASP